jgi:hypothetical protein
MNKKISQSEYITILDYYKIPIPQNKLLLKHEAEKVLATKLCRCIKKVDINENNETKSIKICSANIFNKKGYTRGTFKCTPTHKSVTFSKNTNKNKCKGKGKRSSCSKTKKNKK